MQKVYFEEACVLHCTKALVLYTQCRTNDYILLEYLYHDTISTRVEVFAHFRVQCVIARLCAISRTNASNVASAKLRT